MKTLLNVASREKTSPAGAAAGRSLLARYGMPACCLVMLLPVGYLLGGGTRADGVSRRPAHRR